MRRLFIYVGGVPAVGKTSIIQEAEKLAHKRNIQLKRTIGSDIMCELAGVSDVSDLRRLPEETRRALRPEMNRRIYEEDRREPCVVRVCDGHFCFFDFEGESHGERQIQPWDKEQMKAFVVVLASPNIILQRRMADRVERPDRQLKCSFIAKEQKLEVKVATEQATQLCIPIGFIVNEGAMNISEEAGLLLDLIEQWVEISEG